MAASPTQRTLALLRDCGYTAAVVERWIPRANIRRDLFGVGDVFAFSVPRREFLLVQCTSGSNLSSRLRKAKASVELQLWLKAGGVFQVHGWEKRGPRWHVRRVEMTDRSGTLPLPRIRPRGRQGELFGG